jgi:Clp amino terminal domain, pathogenicity island component
MTDVPSPDALAGLVAESASDDSPAERLRRAVDVSRRLTERADELVERFVSEARAAGVSWAEIGEAFGTSKQAAQKRYAAVGATLGLWPAHLADSARRAMQRAVEAASELGNNYVGTEHALVGLVETESGLAAHALTDLGVTREGVLRQLPPLGEPRPYDALGVMPRVKRALELAGDIAARLGHRQINTEHLLAAIVQVPDAYAVCLLDKLGVGAKDVYAGLAARMSVDAELLVAQRRRRRRRLGRTAA